MSSFFSPSSYLPLSPKFHQSHFLCLQPHYGFFDHYYFNGNQHSVFPKFSRISLSKPMSNLLSTISAVGPANEGTVSVINFEDLMEKDWSFLESGGINSEEQHNRKTDWIISAAEIGETSKVLISSGSEGFVDRVTNSSPCEQLLVVHDSLLTLACIKEKYDKVKCWQGELIYLPEKWGPFDALFLYFLPGLSSQLEQVLETLAKRCLPGARLVISHPQGRQGAEEQKKHYPDIVLSELPDKMTLQSVASDYSFHTVKFVDEPGFYLAVLKFKESNFG